MIEVLQFLRFKAFEQWQGHRDEDLGMSWVWTTYKTTTTTKAVGGRAISRSAIDGCNWAMLTVHGKG